MLLRLICLKRLLCFCLKEKRKFQIEKKLKENRSSAKAFYAHTNCVLNLKNLFKIEINLN